LLRGAAIWFPIGEWRDRMQDAEVLHVAE
jgi:hypothetical protein